MATITGDKKLDRKLKRMGKKAPTIASAATRKGLRILTKEIKSEIPRTQRSIKKAIGWRFKRKGKDGQVLAKAGVNVGKKKAQMVPYAAPVVMGTDERTTQGGASRGKIKGNEAVKNGYSKSQGKVKSTIIQGVRDGIAREAAKA